VAVAVIVGLAIGSGGDEDATGGGDQQAAVQEGDGSGDGSQDEQQSPAPETNAEEPTGGGGGGGAAAPADDPNALNDEGYALNQQGRYAEAIPLLEQAVQGLEGSGDELTYNYALYNLAVAYNRSGDPESAIPLLEQRLQYPNQTETVQAELDDALAAAGQTSDGGVEAGGSESTASDGGVVAEKPGNGPKPGRGTDKFEEGDD
jgi:tetratricopeptide (TPR) repeat protein